MLKCAKKLIPKDPTPSMTQIDSEVQATEGTGQEFNASDFIQYPRHELESVDHHHINCVLRSSKLQAEDTHEEMLMKHDAVKQLMNKMKQRAKICKNDMGLSKKTEQELTKLTKEQEKTIDKSHAMEKKRRDEEHKDMQDCLRVRMREVEKCEQARMEN